MKKGSACIKTQQRRQKTCHHVDSRSRSFRPPSTLISASYSGFHRGGAPRTRAQRRRGAHLLNQVRRIGSVLWKSSKNSGEHLLQMSKNIHLIKLLLSLRYKTVVKTDILDVFLFRSTFILLCMSDTDTIGLWLLT